MTNDDDEFDPRDVVEISDSEAHWVVGGIAAIPAVLVILFFFLTGG